MEQHPFTIGNIISIITTVIAVIGSFWIFRIYVEKKLQQLEDLKMTKTEGVTMEKKVLILEQEIKGISEKLDTIITMIEEDRRARINMEKALNKIEIEHNMIYPRHKEGNK